MNFNMDEVVGCIGLGYRKEGSKIVFDWLASKESFRDSTLRASVVNSIRLCSDTRSDCQVLECG